MVVYAIPYADVGGGGGGAWAEVVAVRRQSVHMSQERDPNRLVRRGSASIELFESVGAELQGVGG